jgi:hypothetical protein
MTAKKSANSEFANPNAIFLRRWWRRGVLPGISVLGLILLAACAYQPGYRDNPFKRSFSWFSYLNADDLRSYCAAGGPDRYRIVYNGRADEQVRTYDLTATSTGGADLVVQVSGGADFSKPIPLDDLLSPWRGKIERTIIGRGPLRAIRDALRASHFDMPPPSGTRVHSWNFFWLAMACESGRFTYNGWGYGSPRFNQVVLQKSLMAVDPTGIAFNPPREVEPPEIEGGRHEFYELYVTSKGTKGNFTLF